MEKHTLEWLIAINEVRIRTTRTAIQNVANRVRRGTRAGHHDKEKDLFIVELSKDLKELKKQSVRYYFRADDGFIGGPYTSKATAKAARRVYHQTGQSP